MVPYNGDGYARSIWKDEFDVLELSPPSPVLCQADPKHTRTISVAVEHVSRMKSSSVIELTSLRRCLMVSLAPFPRGGVLAANLSPRPCAMMTVAVCFLTAGTTSAGAAILWIATILLALIDGWTQINTCKQKKKKATIVRYRRQALFHSYERRF